MKGAEGWTGAATALGPRVRGGDSAGRADLSSGLGDLGRQQADWKWRRNGLKRLIPAPGNGRAAPDQNWWASLAGEGFAC